MNYLDTLTGLKPNWLALALSIVTDRSVDDAMNAIEFGLPQKKSRSPYRDEYDKVQKALAMRAAGFKWDDISKAIGVRGAQAFLRGRELV